MEQELVNAVLAMDDNTVATRKKFVVFIDTQVDFMIEGSALYVTGAEPVISKLNHFAYHLDPREVAGVLFTYDTHFADTYPDMPESKQFPIHCVHNTPGWQNVIRSSIIDAAIPRGHLIKGVFNMWEEDGLTIETDDLGSPELHRHATVRGQIDRNAFFTELAGQDVDIVIVGVAADFCVKWAADGFLDRGFHVEIPRQLTAGILRDVDTMVREDYEGCNILVTE